MREHDIELMVIYLVVLHVQTFYLANIPPSFVNFNFIMFGIQLRSVEVHLVDAKCRRRPAVNL